MGKLATLSQTVRALRLSRRNRRLLLRLGRDWGLPLVLTLVILFGIHASVKADPAPSESDLAQYLQNNSLQVGIEPVGDYDQVYYIYNGQQIQLTSDGYNHIQPVSSGPYVAWQGQTVDGSGQIFLYNVLTDALIQLSIAGNNEIPAIYQNQVVWQTWDGQDWQIDYYNGTQVQQITDDPDPSVRASINANQIIYAEQLGSDDWEAQSYDTSTGQTSLISEGSEVNTAYPQFNADGTIRTAFVPQ